MAEDKMCVFLFFFKHNDEGLLLNWKTVFFSLLEAEKKKDAYVTHVVLIMIVTYSHKVYTQLVCIRNTALKPLTLEIRIREDGIH